MKTKVLLFLACATVARAFNYLGDHVIVAPFNHAGAANLIGNVTLSSPGRYVAAGWNIVGNLTFASPGDYTIEATSGGINLTGQMISCGGPATLHVKYVRGLSLLANSPMHRVAVIDETRSNFELPTWTQTFTVAVGDRLVYTPPVAMPSACQWRRNGTVIPGATSLTLTLPGAQPSDAGIYTLELTDAHGTRTMVGAVVGVRSSAKVVGDAIEVQSDVLHPNGRRYDQVLLNGAAATVTADPGQVTRVSFIDLTDDIVQVELSGPGSLSVVLADASGPALPLRYNQSIAYMKGHATLVLANSDDTTNISVFSVGKANAVNPGLFKSGVSYDGVADIAALALVGPAGRIGGLFMGNANFFAICGVTGVYATGFSAAGPVRIGNVNAFDRAVPVLLFGAIMDLSITGGDLNQDNGRAVLVQGLVHIGFCAGVRSDGTSLPIRINGGVFIRDGIDVTTWIVGG